MQTNLQVKVLNRGSKKKLCAVWLFVFYAIIKDLLNLLILFWEVAAIMGNKTNGMSFESEVLCGIKSLLGIER